MVTVEGEEFLSASEAARRLNVKRATLYAYVSRGVLRSYRQGIKRQRLYRRTDVEELLRVSPTDSAARRRAWEIPLAETWIRD
ncbi:MAG: helix-turn-helix domain-containing protein [Candidatus Rokubacteria bacterium]|nr:helix-turn-helix domain-containing protein [Candidatus Rokubacteria bacterium]MBI3826463.1 helix-turn-helix domain-containing protein [Candidatus Rokubacteria bacterium]